LDDAERMEVMTFNNRPELAFGQLQQASAGTKQQANDYLAKQAARGGTVLLPAISTAYKYAAKDRPLNVIILSDGLTEPQERHTLLQQIQSRPGNTRVFCIGVGNDVDRPLLEQLAEDSGGLSAFISAGDDFTRQAKAFRQKLVRPFATDLQLKFNGIEVTDLEPAVVPNLYFGAPVRIYGRYRGSGTGEITLRGSVRGVEIKQTAQLEFPKSDANNPEINRLWASHRINSLLKDADRRGDRGPAIPQIVRLGEDFSIVTEYTSFLVLENDAEYQRWKITRRNLESTGRDRQTQAKLREQLETIRNKALSNIGPQSADASSPSTSVQLASIRQPVNPSTQTPAPRVQSQAESTRPQSVDFRLSGSSPVGPFGALFSIWLLRRKRKAA
jgi:Ca-activated chloride channel family protein